jgi:anti-sigma regulatory factor (Ser/Thr protein kinase)
MRAPRCELRVKLPATLEAIESFCVQFQHWRGVACSELDAFSSELLLREALTNSVMYGGSEGAREGISCVLRVKRGRLIIAIRDGGKGFDWRAAWDGQADAEETHGRGMEIFRLYANLVRFNPKGNSVTLIKRF